MYPSQCGKGQVQKNGSYRYRCNACRGHGVVGSGECQWCFKLDIEKLCAAIKTARGARVGG